MFRSRRLTQYILEELIPPTFLGATLYTFVLLMNHFFFVAEKTLSKNLDASLAMRLFAVGIPKLLVLSIPMSILLGTMIGMGRLSADQEWVALQSAGRGLRVLLWPVLIHGALGALITLVVYSEVVPRSNLAGRNLRGELVVASNIAADLRPREFYTHLPEDAVLFVDEIRPGGERRLEGVLVIQPDREHGTTKVTLAREANLYLASDGSGDLVLDLYDGVWHLYNPDEPLVYRMGGEGSRPGFSLFRDRLSAAAYVRALLEPPSNRVAQDLTLPELVREYRTGRRADGLDRAPPDAKPTRGDELLARHRQRRIALELHLRFALPVACVIFALLALPLGISRARSGKGAGFALSLLVILIYWMTFTLASKQAVEGRLPPVVGAWGANFLLLPWIAYGLWRLRRPPRREREPLLTRLGRALARLLRRRVGPESGAETARSSPRGRGIVGRLDLYLAQHFARVLLTAILSGYLVYVLVEFKNLTEGALRTRQPFALMLRYFVFFWPGVLHVVLPVSCLVAAVVAYTLLGRNGEIVAIKAAGISLRRAVLPALAVTALLCAGLFLVQDRIAPSSSRKAQEVRDQITGRAPRSHGQPLEGTWSFGPGGQRLYHYRLYDAALEVFQGLSVFTLDRATPRIVDHRFAKRARWNGQAWELDDSWYRTFPADGDVGKYEVQPATLQVELDSPASFAGKQTRLGSALEMPEQLSLTEIKEQIATLRHRGYDVTRLRVAYHGKYAQAVSPLVMVLLGLPFAFRVGRRGSLYGIGVALLLVLVYWAAFATFNALGLETLLSPPVAAWAPNVLFGLLGAYLMLYVKT